MPQELEFSIMAVDDTGIRPLLDAFEKENHIHVRVTLLSWDSAWSSLVRNAIYGDGPDISEVGNTWLGDLIGMNALRPFSPAEMAELGHSSEFLPLAVKPCLGQGEATAWAIPWLASVRLVYYRASLLRSAGIDLATAFSGIDCFEKTISSLQSANIPIPWAVPTNLARATLLNVASWLWASGGTFLAPDLRSTRFMEPQALDGLAAYYRLGRFLGPGFSQTSSIDSDDVFMKHLDCAMALSGAWMMRSPNLKQGDDVYAALPPGPSFVGGSDLVVWKHSKNASAAFKLVRFLTSVPAQISYSQHGGLLPVRLAALQSEPYISDPHWQVAVSALHSGRTFPISKLWGLVEDRLTTAFWAAWNETLADPDSDPLPILTKLLGPLARRLDETLKQ
jgi:multiple sugar transport system substrate-binding protein